MSWSFDGGITGLLKPKQSRDDEEEKEEGRHKHTHRYRRADAQRPTSKGKGLGPNTAAVRLNKRSPPPAEGSVNQLTAGRRFLYATCLLGA